MKKLMKLFILVYFLMMAVGDTRSVVGRSNEEESYSSTSSPVMRPLAQNWGEFRADQCTAIGYRQYSSVLWNIPWGKSWEAACSTMPADINGYYFDRPARCVNTGTNMWGEFDVPDNSCQPYWGNFKADQCTAIGYRQYSSVLWNIPDGFSWEDACSTMPADINGYHFDRPTRCIETGGHMWGEFDVPEDSCQPYWGNFKADQCTAIGYRQYSSVLWNIPSGQSWEAACSNMPADINGYHFDKPTRCVNAGTNMWGEFDVPEESCPYWGDFQKDQCTGWGKRQFSSILHDIPAGVSWEWACTEKGAAIEGQSFSSPNRCINTGTAMWGQFDINDSTCLAHWGEFKKDYCTNTGKRQYSAVLYDPPPGVSWEEACANTPATIEGQYIGAPTRCVKTDIAGIDLQMWGEFDVNDATCDSVTECPGCRSITTGFADLHNHQFANLAFGGKAIVGEAFGPIRTALPHCDYKDGNPADWVHGPGGARDAFGTILNPSVGHLVGGYPEFDGWPRWNSFTHQVVYEDWLRRAHQGGLKLMVMHAVNNEFACSLVEKAPGRTCDDMEAVNLQIAAAKQMEAYIDSKSGGPGQGWYRIVYSPQEARTAISKGQLAVILGIEVDSLFHCSLRASCTPQHVMQELEKYYDLGIRHLFPIHFYDNGFGGAALAHPLIVNQTTNPPLTRDCTGEGYIYNGGLCNARGLTDLGKFLVRAMISKGMIIDIDHMSALSFDDTLDIAESFEYPVVSGHTGFIDVSNGDKNHEGNLKAEQIERIRKVGGMVAVILNQGTIEEIDTYRGAGSTVIEHTCGNTSETWAQAYLYAVEKMGSIPVAFGTDMNGGINPTGPRFGPEACPGGTPPLGLGEGVVGPINRVDYPFVSEATGATMNRSIVGKKIFDINEDGLAHIGLLPDFIADLQNLGLTAQDLSPLLNSAEGYIQVWERAERNKAVMSIPSVLHDGTLLREPSGTIYVIYGGAQFGIPNMTEFNALNFEPANVIRVWNGALAAIPTVPRDGTLLREPSGAIYVIYGGAKFHIPNMTEFNALNFDPANVKQLWNGALAAIPTVPRDGTLLREPSGTIYVIYGGAQFGIPNMTEFNALNFDPANVKQLWNGALATIPTVPRDNTVLKERSSATVYVIINGQKRWVPNLVVLDQYGGSAAVKIVPDGGLVTIPTGPDAP